MQSLYAKSDTPNINYTPSILERSHLKREHLITKSKQLLWTGKALSMTHFLTGNRRDSLKIFCLSLENLVKPSVLHAIPGAGEKEYLHRLFRHADPLRHKLYPCPSRSGSPGSRQACTTKKDEHPGDELSAWRLIEKNTTAIASLHHPQARQGVTMETVVWSLTFTRQPVFIRIPVARPMSVLS